MLGGLLLAVRMQANRGRCSIETTPIYFLQPHIELKQYRGFQFQQLGIPPQYTWPFRIHNTYNQQVKYIYLLPSKRAKNKHLL